MVWDLVKEISEMRKRMATLREDNRRLRNEIMQRNFKNDATKKQEDSLYYLLQEFMVENNNLRAANKELRAKAIKESKLSMKTSNLQSLPILPNNQELSKVGIILIYSTILRL